MSLKAAFHRREADCQGSFRKAGAARDEAAVRATNTSIRATNLQMGA
jgi:hypothetical protein